jgi:uncharacterized cupredoxin-like copper-binding protein
VARKLLALIAIAAFPLALAACGGNDSTSTSASSQTSSTASTTDESSTTAGGGGGETVSIGETEYKLDPSDPTVKAGSVTFDVSNDGQTTHNLEIEGDGVEEVTDSLAPGDSGQLTVDLKPGTYEIYCAIDGHRDLGMEGEVTVK